MSTVRRNRHVTVAATVGTAAASWVLVTQAAGVHLGVEFPHSGASTVALGPTVGAAATATLAGWVTLSILEARVSHPRRTWLTIATGVLLVSFALPAAFAVSVSDAIGLSAIHLAVGTVAITGLARTVSSRHTRDASPSDAFLASRRVA